MSKVTNVYDRVNNRRARVRILIAVFCLTVFAVICLMWTGTVEKSLTYIEKKEMREAAGTVARYNLKNDSYYSQISSLESSHSFYIEIYNADDELIYTSRDNASMLEGGNDVAVDDEMMLKPRIMRVLMHKDEKSGDGSFFEERQEYYGTARYLVYGTDLNADYSVVIYNSLDVLEKETENVEQFIWIAIFVFILISTVTVYLYYNSFIIPIIRIGEVTKNIAKLDFSETCPSSNISEMKELSRNINYLSYALSTALDELKEKNAQLELDILKERETEQIRREFIANASHELKTPIAIIQGYAEGIKVGINDRESSEEYCDVIISEAEKMNNLIIRMLEVSRLSAGMKPNMEKFDGGEHIRRQLRSFAPLFTEAGITVSADGVPQNFMCTGDVTLLDIVFGNYISNAISYAGGKKEIKIYCDRRGDFYRISVFNSGSHIESRDIDKIWIGFYRADKAHSREKGHFGLGLSFVSSIQEMHGCEYGVYNAEGGVVFWFDVKAEK
ncbi:MAG: HAMP domain-containing histidine kinase [Clostridia bacterium]|nr:HAMP domain-containing histidine kinase [Clostridia bacterium]